MSDPLPNYILKIKEQQKQLFIRRSVYVSVKRNWLPGGKIFFVENESFVGFGIIEQFVSLDNLLEQERAICLDYNSYGKIVFGKLTRFTPTVAVNSVKISNLNLLAIHGSVISSNEALQVEEQSIARIIL